MPSFSASHMLSMLLASSFIPSSTGTTLNSFNASRQFSFTDITPSETLDWYPCYDKYKCAKLDVPLDYSVSSSTRASIPLIKIEAQLSNTTDKYEGMIMTNPGGPGESGINWILQHGYGSLLPVIPPTYDLVSWDPRGIGYSTPSADCRLPSQSSKRAYGISEPEVTDAFYTSTLTTASQLGAQCQATIGGPDGAGKHMTTPVVARDIISILDAYANTEQGKTVENARDLNYWGFSYGTVLGQTFASTYPDRVGRFALDGVADAEDYYSQRLFATSIYTDAVVDKFFEYCFRAGSKLCPFSTGNSSLDIKTRFTDLFDRFDVKRAYEEKWDNATILENALGIMLTTLRPLTYTPSIGFPQMAKLLLAYEGALSNLTLENVQIASQISSPATEDIPGVVPGLAEWTPAVFCSEAMNLFNTTIVDYEETIDVLRHQSYIGHVGWTSLKMLCSGWGIEGRWKFKGSLGAATKNPILFISNTFDPATPIDNKKWLPHYKGSRLLTIDAIGHCSYTLKNICANKKIHDFFKNGQLPVDHDNFCESEVGPFGITIRDLKSYSSRDIEGNVTENSGFNSEMASSAATGRFVRCTWFVYSVMAMMPMFML